MTATRATTFSNYVAVQTGYPLLQNQLALGGDDADCTGSALLLFASSLTKLPSMLKLGPSGCVMLMGFWSVRHSWPVVALARSRW